MAKLLVSKDATVYTEPIGVSASGLKPLREVTLYTQARLDSDIWFISKAYYKADKNGCIDLANSESVGGSYTGCKPMGFLWSMEPHPENKRKMARFLQADVENPIEIKLELHSGHFTGFKLICHTDACIAQVSFLKYIKHPSITRQALTGDVKGAIFIPEGEGPFPPVITLYGPETFQVETKAALLAREGFITLALLYFGVPGLPKSFAVFDLEYANKAIKLLLQHPKSISTNGVGIMGSSLGGLIVQAIGAELENVRCVIPVNCSLYTDQLSIKYKSMHIAQVPDKPNIDGTDLENSWFYFINPSSPFEESVQPYLTNFHKRKDVSYLFVFSEDDKNCPTLMYVKHAKLLLDSVGHKNYKINLYQGAGHSLDPPYFPLCTKIYAKWGNLNLPFGGSPLPHHIAQLEVWKDIVSFLKSNLQKNVSKL